MNKVYILVCFAFLWIWGFQPVVAQEVVRSDKAVFYNFTVTPCSYQHCETPYAVRLENVNTVTGSFKGRNPRLKPFYEVSSFLITAYDKRSGEKIWEEVVSNPVDLNIEYAGGDPHADAHAGHGHGHGSDGAHACALQRKQLQLPEGYLSVRLPYGPNECSLHVSYIESSDRVVSLATF
ncbi:MAG TPA: hypothetical protein VEY71_00530 [Chitinophagales bacterium]|nr:hypothetical protein [Chitinophagales bacterium]